MDFTNKQTLEEALRYVEFGFSVIPIGQDKKPLIKWEAYQKTKASKKQIEQWFAQFPNMNIGIVTGDISGIVVVDVESGGDTKELPPTVISRTGGGGWHYFYKHPGHSVKNAVRIRKLTDIRGDGGYVVAPPSLHRSGNRYEWAVGLDMADFDVLPSWVSDELSKSESEKINWSEFLKKENKEGSRNDSATQYVGKLLHHLPMELWEEGAWPMILNWHRDKNIKSGKATDNFTEKELRSVFDSIAEKESTKKDTDGEQKKSEKTQALQIVKLITENETLCFKDEHGLPQVRIHIGDHKETWPCGSKQLKHWLAKTFYDRYEKTVASGAIDTALEVISGMALFGGPEHHLHARVARGNEAIWYDLCDEKWRAVRIDMTGWSFAGDIPVLFRRFSHQALQVEPVLGGNIRDVLRFVNIQTQDQQLLFLVCLVSFFIPGYPHPIPYVYGPQGSAKSTLSKIVRKLVDPSRLEVVSMPRKEEELSQALAHHYLLFFDNVGVISDQQSDLLCRAITGSGFSKRQLYTDDDDIIYSIRANIGINGIELIPGKPDLLERSILFELNRVNPKDRKQEHEMIEEFEKLRPSMLGAIFSAVSRTLSSYPNIQTKLLPRMADFARFGCAIAESIGYTQKEFLDAYLQNINQQNEAVIDEHIEATLLISFMGDKDVWEGTASELLKGLQEISGQASELPKRANAFSRKLSALKTNLEEAGIHLSKSKGTKRNILITKERKDTDGTDTSSLNTPENESMPDNIEDDENRNEEVLPIIQKVEISEKDDKDDVGDIGGDIDF
jgi:hypothetical protein